MSESYAVLARVTPEALKAGTYALSCEFGFPSDNPVVDYEVAALRVFQAMLTRSEVTVGIDGAGNGAEAFSVACTRRTN